MVNGTIYCGKSLFLPGNVGRSTENSLLIRTKGHPDKSVFLPNPIISIAQKKSLYYTEASGPSGSPARTPLAETGALFCQKVGAMTGSETVLELLENPDTADLAILPDNGTYVEDDAVLNDAFLQKYGPSFYINGNLSLNQASHR